MTWPSSSERAHTTTTSAIEPLPIQRLAPSSTQLVAVAARAWSRARPSPSRASGSVSANAPIASSRAIAGSQRCFCSSEPSMRDRLHRQPGLHAEERAEAAVAAVQLHVDEPAGERAHARAAVALDVLADEPQLGEPAHQRPRQLGALPVAR